MLVSRRAQRAREFRAVLPVGHARVEDLRVVLHGLELLREREAAPRADRVAGAQPQAGAEVPGPVADVDDLARPQLGAPRVEDGALAEVLGAPRACMEINQ